MREASSSASSIYDGDLPGSRSPRDLFEELDELKFRERRHSQIYYPEHIPMHTMPNVTGSKFMNIVNPVFVDNSSLRQTQKRLVRNSIFDPAVVAALSDRRTSELARDSGLKARQILTFFISTLIMGFAPIVEQWALWDPMSQKKKVTFILRTPFLVSYSLSILGSLLMSGILYGKDGIENALDIKSIILSSPIALSYIFTDWINLKVQVNLDASLWKIIRQSKLIVIAIFAYLFLGQRQSSTQWMLLISATFIIGSYALIGVMKIEILDNVVFGLACLSIVFACAMTILSEYILKSTKNHFMVQMCHSRISSLICSAGFLFFEIRSNDEWGKFPFGGWTYRTIALVFSDIVITWISVFTIRTMSSIWMALSVAASLSITYLASTFLLTTSPAFDIRQFSLVLAISLNVLGYASSKSDRNKLLQLKLDAERHINENKSHIGAQIV